MSEYIAPEYKKTRFTCPHCGAFSSQCWEDCYYEDKDFVTTHADILTATCAGCVNISIWLEKEMVYPALSTAPIPHDDMPESIKDDYSEARDILVRSPRGACALLRLALEKLCDELVGGNQNLNNKIGELVKRGLPSQLQKAFDFVRITGNDAVHELGEINPKDNPEIAQALFKLINMIIEKMITEPKEVNELYNLIPESKLAAIEKRDTVK